MDRNTEIKEEVTNSLAACISSFVSALTVHRKE